MAESKKRAARLGRGLSSLMAQPMAVDPPAAPAPKAAARAPGGPSAAAAPGPVGGRASEGEGLPGARYLPVAAIVPNRHQPRQHFDEAALKSLAESIRADGVMQPIVVRPTSPGKGEASASYELVAGERRWRAAGLAGLERIPAIVRDLDDRQIAEWALIENLQREDLNPIERAEAFRRLESGFNLSHEQIAGRVGLDRSTVSNLLRLLSLAPGVQQLIRDDLLSMGHARALAGLTDAAQQESLAKQAVREGMSVRAVEQAVRRVSAGSGETAPAGEKGGKASHFRDLEQQIGQQLNTRVAIQAGRKKGAGKLTIEFYSLDQFDNLLSKLGVTTEG